MLVITPATGFNTYGRRRRVYRHLSNFYADQFGSGLIELADRQHFVLAQCLFHQRHAADAGQTSVTIGLNTAASNLVAGTYVANVWFTNQTIGNVQSRQFTLHVVQPLFITPTTGFTATGPVGGPFNVTSQNFSLTNAGTVSLNWCLINTSLWLNASPTAGTLAEQATATVTVSLNSAANNLATGVYTASLWFTNQTGHAAQTSCSLCRWAIHWFRTAGLKPAIFVLGPCRQTPGNYVVDNGTYDYAVIRVHLCGLGPGLGSRLTLSQTL